MSLRGRLDLVRDGDALVLEARHAPYWLGALFSAFAVFFLIAWARQSAEIHWLGTVVGVFFVAIGLFLLLPREVTTRFDLRARRVVHHVRVCHGVYERRHEYDFDEVAGLGVREFENEGFSYMPVLVLRGGKVHWLSTANGGQLAFAKAIEEVCAATGLAKVDIAHRG